MRFFERMWRRLARGPRGDEAERAELEGDLQRAIRLWMAAGAVDEAARVMTLRGDAEPDPKARLQHYTQAVATATPGGAARKEAGGKRARLTLALARDGAVSSAVRRDVTLAGEELEQAGDFAAAADAFALAGDVEGEARALTQAGEVDRLDRLLTRDQATTTRARGADDAHARIDALVSAGQRREALALAEAAPDDPGARARAARIQGARIDSAVVRVTWRGGPLALVLGDEVTIGRAEGAIIVPSSVLSRAHLRLARAFGRVVATDLGSHNGTQLRGQNLAHPLDVTDGVTLSLGGEVPLTLAPSAELGGVLAIEVGGGRYVAPLGEARLGVDGWRLVRGEDGWVELVTEGGPPAYAGELELAPRVTLLRGDAVSSVRGGEVVLRVEDGGA